MTLVSGSAPRLAIRRERRLSYAPVFCSASEGCCSCLSDSYSVGKLLSILFDESQMPLRVSRWCAESGPDGGQEALPGLAARRPRQEELIEGERRGRGRRARRECHYKFLIGRDSTRK